MNYIPKVSVAIPAYKARFLRDAIDSILAQTFKDFELVVVDDCSPEDIQGIVNQYQDPRIHYHRNAQNLGRADLVANWNRCLELAQGEFFALLCDDDVYEPTFLEEMLALADKYPSVNVFRGRARYIDSEGQVQGFNTTQAEYEPMLDYLWHSLVGRRDQSISEFFYRRLPMLEVGGYTTLPVGWCADILSVCRFAQKSGFAFSNKFLVGFRMSGENISSTVGKYNVEKLKAYNLLIDHWLPILLEGADPVWAKVINRDAPKFLRSMFAGLVSECAWGKIYFLLCHRAEFHLTWAQLVKAILHKLAR